MERFRELRPLQPGRTANSLDHSAYCGPWISVSRSEVLLTSNVNFPIKELDSGMMVNSTFYNNLPKSSNCNYCVSIVSYFAKQRSLRRFSGLMKNVSGQFESLVVAILADFLFMTGPQSRVTHTSSETWKSPLVELF